VKLTGSQTQVEETQREVDFRKAMLLKQMKIVDVSPDGNCLFRAMSVLLFGDQTHHNDIRNKVCDYLVEETKVRDTDTHVV
jgi:hypothetical protein